MNWVKSKKLREKDPDGFRTCTGCLILKPNSEFGLNGDRKIAARCRGCINLAICERRKKNPEKSRSYKKAWRSENPEKAKFYAAKYALKHPNRNRERSSNYRKNNPRVVWDRYLRSTFGIDANQYEDLLAVQNGVCAICCGSEVKKHQNGQIKRLSVDHDHSTGVIRGLLCDACNSILGLAKDSRDRLETAAKYLSEHANIKPKRKTHETF